MSDSQTRSLSEIAGEIRRRDYLVIQHRFVRLMGVGYLPREVRRFSASWPVMGRAKRFMRGLL